LRSHWLTPKTVGAAIVLAAVGVIVGRTITQRAPIRTVLASQHPEVGCQGDEDHEWSRGLPRTDPSTRSKRRDERPGEIDGPTQKVTLTRAAVTVTVPAIIWVGTT
jgi:hypothetical protein